LTFNVTAERSAATLALPSTWIFGSEPMMLSSKSPFANSSRHNASLRHHPMSDGVARSGVACARSLDPSVAVTSNTTRKARIPSR
jgi:hypothetical protein